MLFRSFKTNYYRYSTPNTNKIHHWFDESLETVKVTDTRDYIERPNTDSKENIDKTITKNKDTANQVAMAANTAVWTSSEIARMKYAEITGNNLVPGDRRIYTIWENVICEPDVHVLHVQTPLGSYHQYNDCEKAVKFEVIKYVHQKLIRRVCNLLGQDVGKPWK